MKRLKSEYLRRWISRDWTNPKASFEAKAYLTFCNTDEKFPPCKIAERGKLPERLADENFIFAEQGDE